MATYRDMTPWSDSCVSSDGQLIAVGWLGPGVEFANGRVAPEFFQRFKQLMAERFVPPGLPLSPGVASCPLCQFDPAMGNGVLFVPDGQRMFVTPFLAVHYVATHYYRPPDEFIDAVSTCPSTGTRDYRVQFLQAGGRQLMKVQGG